MKFLKLSILSLTYALSQSPDSLYQLGNNYYVNEEYDQAINIYEEISRRFEHEYLYLNLGNSYYKVGDLGNAIWSYEKGHLLSPRDNDINYNLNFVRNQIRDRIIPPDNIFLISFYRAIIEKLTLLDLIATSGMIFLILGIAFISRNFDLLSKRITSFINTVLLFLIISNALIMLDKYWNVSDQKSGVIISIESNVRSSPINRGENIVFLVHEGTKIEIITEESGWYEIVLLDGKKGWIPKDEVRTI